MAKSKEKENPEEKEKIEEKELKIVGEPAKKPEGGIRITPNVEADFVAIMQDYGVPEQAAVVITKHIADTGSDKVFEKPNELIEKLAKFPRQIPPVTRRNILDHWIALNKITVPEGYEEEVVLTPDELKRKRGGMGKEPEAKYSVDTGTGQIKVASTTDKTALTWDEADKLSENTKKEINAKEKVRPVTYVYDAENSQVRMAKESEPGGTLDQAKELKRMADAGKPKTEAEMPFTQDEQGNWIPNPKAKFSAVEMIAWDSIRKAQARGEEPDPLDYLTKAKALFGDRGGTVTELVTALVQLQELTKGDKSIAEALKAAIDKIAEKPKEDEATKTLKEHIDKLETSIQGMREAQFKAQIDALQTAITNLNSEIKDMRTEMKTGTQLEGRYALLGKAIEKVDGQLTGFRTDVRPLVDVMASGGGGAPKKRTPEEKVRLTKGLKQAIQQETRAKQLEDKLLFGGKPQG